RHRDQASGGGLSQAGRRLAPAAPRPGERGRDAERERRARPMSDPVSVIESAYAADGSDESAWLGRVAAAVNKNIPSSSGSALAYSYTVAKDGYINIRAMAELGDI